AARSRRVVPVENLPLANEVINQIAPLGEYIPDAQALDIVAPGADDARTLIVDAETGERIGENDRVFEVVGGRGYVVRAGGFWQVHREAPLTLFEAVRDEVLALGGRFDPGAMNLDLYGGV